MNKQEAKAFETLYEKYEGTARWGALFYATLLLAKHFLFGQSMIISIMLDTTIFMVFSLGLRKIALDVCCGNEPLARECFWAFKSPFCIWNATVGICVSILFNLLSILCLKLPHSIGKMVEIALYLYIEIFSFLYIQHTPSPERFCGLFREIGKALKNRQGVICYQIRLLLRYGVLYLVICLVVALIAYDANRNALQDIDALSDSFMVIYAIYAFVFGPKFFLKNNYNFFCILNV